MTTSEAYHPSVPRSKSLPKYWQVLVPILYAYILIAGLGGAVRLAAYLGQPFAGVVIVWRKEIKIFVVGWQTPDNWPGIKSDLSINDRILCVNGYRPNTDSPLYALDPIDAAVVCPGGGLDLLDIFNQQYALGAQELSFTVDHAGQIIELSEIPLIPFGFGHLLEIFLPSFLGGLGLWVVGWLVYKAAPQEKVNLAFSVFAGFSASFAFLQGYMGIIGSFLRETRLITLAMSVPWVSWICVAGFEIINQLFYDQLPRRWLPRLKQGVYILAVFCSVTGIYTYLDSDSTLSIPLTWLFLGTLTGLGAFTIGWAGYLVFQAYRHSPSLRVRRQAAIIIAGLATMTLATLPFLTYTFLNIPGFPLAAYIPYLGLGLLACIAYTILRYQLFPIRTRLLHYLILLITCILLAVLVTLMIHQEAIFLPVLIASIVTGLLFEGRFSVFDFLDNLLRREKLDYQAVTRFTEQVGDLRQSEALPETVLRLFIQEFSARQVDFWMIDPSGSRASHYTGIFQMTRPYQPISYWKIFSAEPGGAGNAAQTIQVIAPELVAQPSKLQHFLPKEPFPFYESKFGTPDLLQESGIRFTSGAIWSTLLDHTVLVGYLRLDERWTGEIYDDEDLRLVNIISQQLALAIANQRQYQHVRDLQNMLLQAEDHERDKVARELHDTILQFLHKLTFGLDEIKENSPLTAPAIRSWQERIHAEAIQMRDLLTYLRSPETLIQSGLVNSLHKWLDRISQDTNVITERQFDPEVDRLLRNPEKTIIFRIFRESVHNAIRHAAAGQIKLWLYSTPEHIELGIQDNGRGFDLHQNDSLKEKGYSSLEDMKIYLASLGGWLEIDSAPGKGTKIFGQMPVHPISKPK